MVRESSLPDPAFVVSCAKEHVQEAVVARIAQQAALQPDATAISSPTQSLSFLELDSLSRNLASQIYTAGVRPGNTVGLYLPSSTHFVVAALAAWKARASYLPIDVTAPGERTSYMLHDSGAVVVVTLCDHVDTLPRGPWKTILLGGMAQEIDERQGAEEQVADCAPVLDDLAYLIYTSGSTGKPKGVEITHRNLLHLVNWHSQTFAVSPQDRATQIAGLAFDAAVWELWPHLCSGASVHIPPAEARQSAVLLQDWLLSEKITISFVPTVLAEELMQLSWPGSTDLRVLLTGGDALHTFPSADLPFTLVNNYGPTEATVVATSGVISPASEQMMAPAIGKEILHTGILLVDEDGQPVGIGEIGEIVITGEGVGRGYRNQPVMTAARFVTLEVNGSPRRAFRTGDLARRLSDGQLAFAGRADGQVKIRGFRIELDEIAFNLNQHPAVLWSAVIADDAGTEKRLVAYLVLIDGEIGEAQMREFLSSRLPDYMIPMQFAVLDRVPVTENGKLDREALPPPSQSNRLAQDPYLASRNEVEQIVEGILSSILGLERVSLDDNFFLLGGHSLMGAQVIARLRDMFGVELSLRNVFENPTVTSLSANIELLLTKKLEAMTDEEVLAQLEVDGDEQAMFSAGTAEN